MGDTLYFARSTKCYIAIGSDFWEIPLQEGFSFAQATNTSEVSLNEAGDTSRRGRKVFNDSLAPAEWSFTTYLRPFISGGTVSGGGADDSANHHCIEEALWACMVGNSSQSYTAPVESTSDAAWGQGLTSDTTDLNISFASSNNSQLKEFTLYFHLADDCGSTDAWYEIQNCAIDEVSVDIDIDGIAQATWTGFGKLIDDYGNSAPAGVASAVTESITDTDNYIRNRVSTVALDGSADSHEAAYNFVLTGGNITINNNISYLTPETLASVNQPLRHVTGTREVSGTLNCYLGSDGSSPGVEPRALYDDLQSDLTTVTGDWEVTVNVGGSSAPKVTFLFAHAHLEIPQVQVEDVYGLEVNFHGLGQCIDDTDEVAITYVGA